MSHALDDTLDHVLEQRLAALLTARREGRLTDAGTREAGLIADAFTGRLAEAGPLRENTRGLPSGAAPGKSPSCVLMIGLPGSGKTTLARLLVEQCGMTRMCPDEVVFARHGRYGYDFPRGQYRVREQPILREMAEELTTRLGRGEDVVFDHGFWTPGERDEWRTLIAEAGGVPLTVYLPAAHDLLWQRVKERNARVHEDPNSMEFAETDLLRFAGRFFPPTTDEPHLTYQGNLESVLGALARGQERP
ncbi:AAA family ATPase [Streptomyces avidinii]|uniref:AAA family ATPase n=1 Tax=Streptomyces avidinii TaxID=1895 RepID=UPI0037A6BDF9